jgi:hypothetical protein
MLAAIKGLNLPNDIMQTIHKLENTKRRNRPCIEMYWLEEILN